MILLCFSLAQSRNAPTETPRKGWLSLDIPGPNLSQIDRFSGDYGIVITSYNHSYETTDTAHR